MEEKKLQFIFDESEIFDKSYYNEIFYIMHYSKKYMKNPNRKPGNLFTDYILLLFVIVFIALLILFGFNNPKNIVIKSIILAVYGIMFVVYLFSFIVYSIQLKRTMSDHTKRIFTMTENEIGLWREEKNISASLDRISCIIVNKHSICFLPDTVNGVLFALPVYCKNEVFQFLSDIGRTMNIVET